MAFQLSQTDRYRGSLLGLAIGDAIGTTVEFCAPDSFEPLKELVGGGPFDLQAGQWTDDTSMALCLAESLLACGKFHPVDQMERYVKWYREGYLSSTGVCFDIGNTVRTALERFELTGEPFCGSFSRMASGNGSLMRLAPVPLYYAANPQEAIVKSGDSSLTTHGSILTVDACRYYAALIIGALQGVTKEQLLTERFSPVAGFWEQHYLITEIDEVAKGSFKRLQPPDIKGSGYVVKSLEAALWAFYHSSSFAEGCLLAANLGDDADTTAAIYGQLAGAYYGVHDIPEHWLDKLTMKSFIQETADRLLRAADEVKRCG
ncbi:ADP-ribosylglycohydrolase family protein [Paenibacillus radicis (ex Xue et al. 2023)]|uniref:ADP-ribosylglycohydrolase family protein n=1 Tax=Paenibacillus radicis (ex Xue et al. 2023) TaxID=2972489 RepID=A0ABT1YG43_9BACL|nr:ADP-ribosylglycohydrolase family protein [Paenibacillus radicis (ex Xue et al. 2023)]MCR8631917.1 ADP-ribosylglycohydrolase family protein [Paenibacillus radicis (ex Xue et al. 2023)]